MVCRARCSTLDTVRRALTLPALALTTALAVSTGLAVGGPGGALGATGHPARIALGSPGHWNKVSSGSVPSSYVPSVVRTGDGALHVVYAKDVMDGIRIGHTALNTAGTVTRRNDVLASGWNVLDTAPVVVRGVRQLAPSALRRCADTEPGLLVAGPHVRRHQRDGRRRLDPADRDRGTEQPRGGLAGHRRHDTGRRHPGGGLRTERHADVARRHRHTPTSTTSSPRSRTAACSAPRWSATATRSGSRGTRTAGATPAAAPFAMQIYPTMGSPIKAPGSSVGANSVYTGRVALAARAGGGVFAAYCVGAPTCTAIRIWKVGTDQTVKVPGSKLATSIALVAPLSRVGSGSPGRTARRRCAPCGPAPPVSASAP